MRQVSRFLAVGVAATSLQYIIYGVLLQSTAWPAVADSMIGYLAGSVLSYALNYHLTFASARSHASAVPRFYVMVAAAFVLNAAIVALLVDMLALNVWVGQVAATAICLAFNYAVSRFWVFAA